MSKNIKFYLFLLNLHIVKNYKQNDGNYFFSVLTIYTTLIWRCYNHYYESHIKRNNLSLNSRTLAELRKNIAPLTDRRKENCSFEVMYFQAQLNNIYHFVLKQQCFEFTTNSTLNLLSKFPLTTLCTQFNIALDYFHL